MSTEEKLRSLLAEARTYLKEPIKDEVREHWRSELHRDIDNALSEPIDITYTQEDVNQMTADMIQVRKDYEKIAFKAGVEAAAVKCESESPTHGVPTSTGAQYARLIRSIIINPPESD